MAFFIGSVLEILNAPPKKRLRSERKFGDVMVAVTENVLQCEWQRYGIKNGEMRPGMENCNCDKPKVKTGF